MGGGGVEEELGPLYYLILSASTLKKLYSISLDVKKPWGRTILTFRALKLIRGSYWANIKVVPGLGVCDSINLHSEGTFIKIKMNSDR